jgi:hypothetical protein
VRSDLGGAQARERFFTTKRSHQGSSARQTLRLLGTGSCATTSLGVLLEFGEDEFGNFLQRVEDALALNRNGFESGLAFYR